MPGEYSNTAQSAIIALGGFLGSAPSELPTNNGARVFAQHLHLKLTSLTSPKKKPAGYAGISLTMSMHGQTKLSMHSRESTTGHCLSDAEVRR